MRRVNIISTNESQSVAVTLGRVHVGVRLAPARFKLNHSRLNALHPSRVPFWQTLQTLNAMIQAFRFAHLDYPMLFRNRVL